MTTRFDDDDPLVEAIERLGREFGTAFSTSASGIGGTGGVVEFNGMKHSEDLHRIAESLDNIAEALFEVAKAISKHGT